MKAPNEAPDTVIAVAKIYFFLITKDMIPMDGVKIIEYPIPVQMKNKDVNTSRSVQGWEYVPLCVT